MMRKAHATVIDPDVDISIAPASDVVVLDMWGEGLPDLLGVHALQVEPQRWWLIDAGEKLGPIAKALGNRGALVPIGGGLMRATLTGPGWRATLMISGVFDAESPNFKAGDCAATLIHQCSVWIDVVNEGKAQVYFPASRLRDMQHLWALAAGDAGR